MTSKSASFPLEAIVSRATLSAIPAGVCFRFVLPLVDVGVDVPLVVGVNSRSDSRAGEDGAGETLVDAATLAR